MMEDQSCAEEATSYGHNADIVQAMKVMVVNLRTLLLLLNCFAF